MTQEELENQQLKSAEDTYGPAPKLDLSKVKNTEAAKAKDNISNDFAKTVETASKKARKSKFCFTEEHEIQIPTNGLLYQDSEDEDIKRGIVRLQPMSLADEEIIANQTYIKNGSVFRHLLNNCMLNNFDAKNFAPYDTYYLLYALRRITYGEDYKFEVQCPECGKKYTYELDISDVEFDELKPEDNAKPKCTIKLPVSKFTIVINMVTTGTEEEVNRLSKTIDAGDAILNFVARTESITDNKGEPVNPNDFADFYEALPGKDRAEISKHFKVIDDLKIPTVDLICPKCGVEDEMQIPFNRDFFRY